ncbi:hypothetical protein LV457_09535 [Mycobacterium sp. MYCO198283]|uniref:hypothetical protein n=1 Tax=Mycobacterium sp. MYCO198283 TaxID=2883505 RepID=UPI001E438C8D|nr:hypothetical protein [Mycobacterium sp. MYCO198283]MCG5432532.1 hypothetical protein [Mycobacterium sp. MYCO198283]
MSGDEIRITPEQVASAGSTVAAEAEEARSAVAPLFDSAEAAAAGNRDFATGPKLVACNDDLRAHFASTVDELQQTGDKIVAAAQAHQATEVDNAEGISRIATALNGLGGLRA